MQKYFPKEELYTTSTEPITIQGDKLALHWPLDTGWEITPNKKPEVYTVPILNTVLFSFDLLADLHRYVEQS